jgi:hypothetical protein
MWVCPYAACRGQQDSCRSLFQKHCFGILGLNIDFLGKKNPKLAMEKKTFFKNLKVA